MNTPTPPDWILIANTTRARVLQQRGAMLEVLESFVHPAGRGHAAQPLPVDVRLKEYTRFAQELAQYLEAEARMGHFASLVILAPLPFLDEVRAALGKFTARMVVATVERDLTSWGVAELGRQISQDLATALH